MISRARFKMILARLLAAIRRHGLLTVIKVLFEALLRHGVVATLRLGADPRSFPWRGNRPSTTLGDFAGPQPDLDEAYSLDVRHWDRWREILNARAPQGVEREEAARLLFVVQGAAPEPGDMERTRAAVAAMGPDAVLWQPGAPDSDARFVVFLTAGDLPSPEMPLALAQAARGGVAEVITFDMVRLEGDRVQPLLLPGANPTLLQTVDYVFSRLAVAPTVLAGATDLSAADPRALVLRWMKDRPAREVRGRWRHVGRPMIEANVNAETIDAARGEAIARNRAPSQPYSGEPITVVICTRDKGHLTRQLVHRLLAEDDSLVGEVMIVSNNTANPYALATLDDLARSPRVTILRRDEPFNFSKLCNAGVRESHGNGPLLFLNDDIVPVSADWLRRLAVRLEDPVVGSVGPLLLYPDERVQHAGVYLGYKGGAGHVLRAARLPEQDYLFTACAAREVSALTGAAVLTPRAAFEGLNGFDEQLALSFQDIDYGLRLKAVGLLNIFEPASILIHMESTSIKSLGAGDDIQRKRHAERMRFLQRWGEDLNNDPLHPRGFDIEDESLRRLAGPTGQRPPQRGWRKS
jgi:GT2 family glycosyltransferase